MVLVMRRCAAFTLFEICLAIAIGLIIVVLAVPSLGGVFAEQKLNATFEEFDTFVRQAQRKSVSERRTYVMVFEEGGISLEPEEPREDDDPEGVEQFTVEDGAEIALERPVALVKEPPMVWMFWRSGTCEPVVVSYRGPAGSWVRKYDPLTARATLVDQQLP